jgi:hypothetical protein
MERVDPIQDIGLLAGRSSKTASLEEIQQAAAKGWSGEA